MDLAVCQAFALLAGQVPLWRRSPWAFLRYVAGSCVLARSLMRKLSAGVGTSAPTRWTSWDVPVQIAVLARDF